MNLDEAMAAAQEHLSGGNETPEVEPEAAAPVEESAPAPEVEAKPAAPERPRAEDGKFVKAPKPKPAPKTVPEKPAAAPKGDAHGAAPVAPPAGEGKADGAASPPAPSAEPAAPALKPPSSLRPAAKEAFAKAPREVQEDIIRIDREVRKVMQESAEATKTAQRVAQTLAPFEGLARAAGSPDAMTYAGSVLQTAAALQMGAPAQKAQIVAQLIHSYGVDLDAINAALGGQAPAHAAPQVDPRAEIRRIWQEEQAQREQAENLRAVQEFLDTEPEFLDAVEADMAAILETDRRRGGKMTPQQAYDRACKLNDEVQDVISKRKAAEAARTRTAATATAKAAAVSIKSQPAAPIAAAKPKGIDAAMDAAREKLGL